MAITIRKATANDAPVWSELFRTVWGTEYIGKQMYDPKWVAGELAGSPGEETWLNDVDGRVRGSISLLNPSTPNDNPVANVGRHLALAENYEDGSARALLQKINEVCAARQQMAILRVPASDRLQQTLLEELGYACVGFQPCKHVFRAREGVLFYVQVGSPDPVRRLPLSHSLPQINELASAALKNLNITNPLIVRDGATGYPLQTELKVAEATAAVYETGKLRAQAANPTTEISGQFNRGLGAFRVRTETQLRFLIGQRESEIVAGLIYYFDEYDRCVRLVDSFSLDDLSTGAMLLEVVRSSQQEWNALYLEVDFLMTAPRALKSAEQIGFVPVAYLPGSFHRDGNYVDVVKMAKLNAAYALDKVEFSSHARAIVGIVDRNFQDQKVGVGIISLLRGLHFFGGLGDGELGKMARLFTQKLYRANERVFNLGDAGSEAYVVLRGQIDIHLDATAKPLASIGNGTIFGEQAFLDGVPRSATAVAAQPSILLVVQRAAFNALIQSEPHLGMVIMRNIATEVSDRLRKANLRRPTGL